MPSAPKHLQENPPNKNTSTVPSPPRLDSLQTSRFGRQSDKMQLHQVWGVNQGDGEGGTEDSATVTVTSGATTSSPSSRLFPRVRTDRPVHVLEPPGVLFIKHHFSATLLRATMRRVHTWKLLNSPFCFRLFWGGALKRHDFLDDCNLEDGCL